MEDLESIHAYIARDSEVYADTLLLEIFAAVDRLKRFPQLGRIVPELNEAQTREIMVGNYRIMYERRGSVVMILAVLHSARQFPPP